MNIHQRWSVATGVCLTLWLMACGTSTPEPGTVPAGGECSLNADCGKSLLCMEGRCAALGGLQTCSPGKARCNGGEVEQCGDDGRGYEFKESCAGRCGNGACVPQVCTPNTTRCQADARTVEACLQDGSGYAVVQTCDLGCTTGVCASSGGSICTPGDRRCANEAIEACTPTGSAWAFLQFCSTGCEPNAKACKAPVCTPFQERCNPQSGEHETCNSTGTALTATPCTSTEACVAGRCTPSVCTPGQKRCLDSITTGVCNTSGTGYTTAVCGANQACASGDCQNVVCAPGSATCSNGTTASVCNATGTGSTPVDCAAQGKVCVAGVCQSSGSVVCVPGRVRCNGADVEECKPDGSGYTYLQSCATTCGNGACAGATCRPFTLNASSAALPADNSSTVLITSEVIANSSGAPVPDGTLFTVSASANTGGVLSADLDSVTQGVQVASVNGKLDFLVKAGPAANAGQSVTATATTLTASSCKGTASFQLVAAGTNLLVAEDFTRTHFTDAASTTASWNVERAEAAFPLAGGFGNGEDGDLYVASGTLNISTQSNPTNPSRTFADAAAYSVTAFATNNMSVTVADFPAGLSAGDEVVLINLQGGSNFPSPTGTSSAGVGDTGNVGNYEVLTVKAVNFGTNQLTFSSPITKIYGATNSNATLTGQKIIVQRIPRYRNATVNGTLTANAWNGAMGGLLFIKVSGALIVSPEGQITMTGKGYRSIGASYATGESYSGPSINNVSCNVVNGGGSPGGNGSSCYWSSGGSYGTAGARGGNGAVAVGYTYGDAQLTRWFLGSAGGRHSSEPFLMGGGIVVLWANTLGVSGFISADGSSSDFSGSEVRSGGGSGGSVYLRANTMNIGRNRVTARGGVTWVNAGGVGRIRVDAASLHAGDTSAPTFTAGSPVSGTLRAQTLALDNVPGTITRARIVSAVQDAQGGTVTYELSSNGGANWRAFIPGEPLQAFDVAASDLRLRVTLTSDGSNRPLGVQGVSIEYLAP